MKTQEGKHCGEKNSNFGNCWLTKDGESIRVKKELAEQYLAEGWIKGRKIKNTENIQKANANRWWIHNDNGESKYINKQDLQKYLDEGWKRGRKNGYNVYNPKPKKDKKDYVYYWRGHVLVEIDGKRQYISNKDPRYLSGEIQAYSKGRIATIDKDGNKFYVKVDDPRYLSGELFPQNQTMKNKRLCHDENWNYFLVEKNDDRLISGELIPSTLGIRYSDETKAKMRLVWKNYIEQFGQSMKCGYSKKGCKYIDQLNEKYGWNLQHAENGGEYEFDGYFIDGYDKERNIAFEYDEPHHYENVYENILVERDLYRQNYIIEHLGCEFYRYNEKKRHFYKVN